MDPDSPFSRVERTFWTVWYYITGAVNRLIRPEPTNTVSNDPNPFQQSGVESDPADSGHPEHDTSGGSVGEEQPLATSSLLSSSSVAWELCTTDINLGPLEKSMQYKSQLSGGNESKAFEEGEGMREEQIGQTGNDDTRLLVTKDARAKEDKEKEGGDHKLHTHGLDETSDNDVYEEHAKMGSLNLTDDVVREDMDGYGRKAGAEEETQGAMIPDDHQKMDETIRKIQVKEEDDKMYNEDEQDLVAEDTEITMCPMTYFSLEAKHNVHMEESRVQRDEADTAVMHEEVENSNVLELAFENENEYDEGAKQVENLFSVCEELSENDRDVKGDPDLTSLNDELQMTFEISVDVSEDVGQELVMGHKSERDKVVDEREEEDDSTLEEREQGGEENVTEAADNQAKDEEPEQEEEIKRVTQDSQGIFTEHVTCNEELQLNAEAELHTAEFTDEEKEDMAKDTGVQTKTGETDDVDGTVIDEKSHVTTTEISLDERFFDKNQIEEERLSSEEEDNKEGYIEIACTTTSVTGNPEGETGQEISGKCPPGMCEGRVVVSQELNSPTCEETQEGVPEYNNEPGPDENTTQRFLEVGDCKEIQAYQLPEEVERKKPESLQNSGVGGDFLAVRQYMKEERESTEDIKEEHTGILQFTDTGLPQATEKLLVEPVIKGSGHLFEEEEGKLLVSSMKTGIEHSEKKFETHGGVTDETDKTAKELQDWTEEPEEVDFEIDEGLCDSRDAAGDGRETMGGKAGEDSLFGFAEENFKILEAEVQKKTERSFSEDSVDAISSEQNRNKTPRLLEDITQSGFIKHSDETEPKLLEDSTVEMQDAGIDVEETGTGVEEEAVEDEMQSKNEMEILNLEEAGMAAPLNTENNKNILLEESELSRPYESLETKNELSAEAFEISNEEMLIDTEAADELMTTESIPKDLALIPTDEMTKHVTESEGSYAEETSSSVSGCQDVIDEEILDLWIQRAVLKDTNGMEKEEGLEPGQQMDTKIEPSNEEQDEIPSVQAEKEKEKLVESNSGESGLMSDTETSSSKAESGFSDQSVNEWGTDQSETQLLKSTSTGSFQGVSDMLASVSESADISELSTQQPNAESQDRLMEEEAETGQSDLNKEESIAETGFHPDSGVLSSEADEERVEPAETETGSQKEIDADVTDLARRADYKDTEEADVETLEKMSTLFNDEKTEVEDAPLEVTVSDSPDEIKHAQTGQFRSGSEALSQEEIMLTESQDDTCDQLENLLKLPSLNQPQPGRSEDFAESLPELNRVEVAEQPATKSEDQTEVDGSALDFTAQRSRIAVKNPRVRPPKDPRSLLNMPSLDPTPSSHLPVKVLTGVPLGGMGIGIKLPGLGAGFPVLKKTQLVVREEKKPETLSQEPKTKPEEKSDTLKQDEIQPRPKWTPPRHPGFGNPLMSELKTKLQKTTKE